MTEIEDPRRAELGSTHRDSRYLLAAVSTAGVIVAVTMAINVLVDPLWLFDGNQIGTNFMTRERLSKAHLFMSERDGVNCIVLGSSRVTLLDARRIERYRCFNFSFSGGSVESYIDYARWVAHFGGPIDLVVVGIDSYSLGPDSDSPETYDFIRNLEEPPSIFAEYANLSILRASIRSALGYTKYYRAYDEQFRGIVLDHSPSYRPPATLGRPDAIVPRALIRHLGPFTNEATPRLERLRRVFPTARYLGYAPPMHPAWFEQMRAQGTLDGYIDGMYAASQVFDAFYDFGIPNELNADPANSYDGSHFREAVNEQIARTLNGSDTGYGIEVTGLKRDEYRRAFLAALDDYVGRPEAAVRREPSAR